MIKNISLCFILCFVSMSIFAQLGLNRQGIKAISEVDGTELIALDHQALKERYKNEKGKPFRFAEARDVYVNIAEHGKWESLRSGKQVWRYILHSRGAYSINLAFSLFELKGDSKLYIYDPKQTEVYGPFTESDNEEHLQLWTPMVSGDKIVIELQCSPEFSSVNKLELARLNHDFADIKKNFLSGDCNLDVICGAADGWQIVDQYRELISSVGAYTLNGRDQCTGVLINSTAQDCRPFFLTADHCDVNENSAASIVVFWNYENSYCRQPGSLESGRPGDGLRSKFNSGAIHRASFAESDFTLVELDDPVNPELNLFFAGWDLDPELPDSSVCIHHPNVEEKRISFEFDPLQYEINGQDTAYLTVTDWDIGTTEGGSSGSPLFNTKKRIIGQLQGGFAACGNDEFDSYGWFRHSWFGGGDSTNSLSYWLDPLNIKPRFLEGRSCSFNLSPSANFFEICAELIDELEVELVPSDFFDTDLNYEILEVSDGLVAELSLINASKFETNKLILSGLSQLNEEGYYVIVNVSDGQNEAQARIDIYIYEGIPEVPSLKTPPNNAIDQSTNLELSIERPGRVINIFELALDEDFENIVASELTESRKYLFTDLLSDQKYYWRVKSMNECGDSEWSETYSFTTASIFCTRISSVDGPFVIDDGAANTVVSTIELPYPAIIQDVNILNVRGIHNYVSDLKLALSFNNRTSILMSELCDDEKDFNLGFDDEASSIHIPCPPTDSLLYVPKDKLSVYDNMLAGGQWQLVIDDLASFDGGEFYDWTMQVCVSEALSPCLIPDQHIISYCSSQDIYFTAFYELGDFGTDYEIRGFTRDDLPLDLEFSSHHGSLNTNSIRIPSNSLSESDESIRLELISLPSMSTIAVAVVRFIASGTSEKPLITNPVKNSTIHPAKFTMVEWEENTALSSIVEISRYSDFRELLIEEELTDLSQLDLSSYEFEEGDHYIRLVQNFDCGIVYSDVVHIILDLGTSIQEISSDEFELSPNPSSGRFVLSSSVMDLSEFEFSLFNSQGQRLNIETELHSDNTLQFDLQQHPVGMYFLRLNSKGRTYVMSLLRI